MSPIPPKRKFDCYSIYDENFHPEMGQKFCMLGATNRELARHFSVVEKTIELWLKTHDEFREAVHRGRDYADAQVAHSLYRRAVGYKQEAVKIYGDAKTGDVLQIPYEENIIPDVSAITMWLRCRQPKKWREVKEVNMNMKRDISEFTEDELSIIAGESEAQGPGETESDTGIED